MIKLKMNEDEIDFTQGDQKNIDILNKALGDISLTQEERSLI